MTGTRDDTKERNVRNISNRDTSKGIYCYGIDGSGAMYISVSPLPKEGT
jgi:hypothetical protein